MTMAKPGEPLTSAELTYFRERQRNRFFEQVFRRFIDCKLSKADLARRLEKRPEQVTRWLSGPGNWELDTISDLLRAMDAEVDFRVVPLADRAKPN